VFAPYIVAGCPRKKGKPQARQEVDSTNEPLYDIVTSFCMLRLTLNYSNGVIVNA
jgi:hypothetical protein